MLLTIQRWSEHIHNITVKAKRTLSFLQRNLKLNNQHLKKTAYFLLVRLQLEYTCMVWSPWQRTDVQSLEKINRRATRFVTSIYHHTSSVSSMIDQLGWQDLETRRRNFHLFLLFKNHSRPNLHSTH